MFTGIVRQLGTVEAVERDDAGMRLRIGAGFAGELGEGDSVAVEGVCLTATALTRGVFAADVMNATLSRTTLGELEPGDRVNLEPALRAGDPLGGHLMQGHVDGVGQVADVREDGLALRLNLAVPDELRPYLVERGSIAVGGASLTISALTAAGFEVSLIPETRERTTLGGLAAADRVNLEVDVVARYVERLMQPLGEKARDGQRS